MTRRERAGMLVASVGMFPLALSYLAVSAMDGYIRIYWWAVWFTAQAALYSALWLDWRKINLQYRDRRSEIDRSHAEEVRLLERLQSVVEAIERENSWLRGRVRELEAEREAERCRN